MFSCITDCQSENIMTAFQSESCTSTGFLVYMITLQSNIYRFHASPTSNCLSYFFFFWYLKKTLSFILYISFFSPISGKQDKKTETCENLMANMFQIWFQERAVMQIVMIVTTWVLCIYRSAITWILQETIQYLISSMGSCVCKEKITSNSQQSVRTPAENSTVGQNQVRQRPSSTGSRREATPHSRSSSRACANVDKLVLETLKLIRTLVDK